MTPEELRGALADLGFDIVSPLPADVYDACVPAAWRAEAYHPGSRSVAVVAHSGRHFWRAFKRSPEASLATDPVDTYARRALEGWARSLRPEARIALYTDRLEGQYLPLGSLAEQAGLGAPSRLGLLLHPTLGPWWSLRAAAFLPHAFERPGPRLSSPCVGCDAPCAARCHGRAVGESSVDLDRCLATRLTLPACHDRCDARLACVVGREHVFEPEQLVHHSRLQWTEELRAQARRGSATTPRERD